MVYQSNLPVLLRLLLTAAACPCSPSVEPESAEVAWQAGGCRSPGRYPIGYLHMQEVLNID